MSDRPSDHDQAGEGEGDRDRARRPRAASAPAAGGRGPPRVAHATRSLADAGPVASEGACAVAVEHRAIGSGDSRTRSVRPANCRSDEPAQIRLVGRQGEKAPHQCSVNSAIIVAGL